MSALGWRSKPLTPTTNVVCHHVEADGRPTCMQQRRQAVPLTTEWVERRPNDHRCSTCRRILADRAGLERLEPCGCPRCDPPARRGAGLPCAWFMYLWSGYALGSRAPSARVLLVSCARCGRMEPRDPAARDRPCLGLVRVELRR